MMSRPRRSRVKLPSLPSMTSPPSSVYLQYRDRVERPSTWRGRRYWILSRGLCAFRGVPAPSAARNDLRNFAGIKGREWAPFADPGFHTHLTRDTAAIWTWDAARAGDAMAEADIRPGRVTVLPETVLQARGEEGLRLVSCLDGFEGQCWSDGELVASRWWSDMPSPQRWIEFLRASRLSPDEFGEVPEP